jgi:hypothetical protein
MQLKNKKRNIVMIKGILSLCFFTLFSSVTVSVFADEAIKFNVKLFETDVHHAKRAAYRALLLKRWDIKKSTETHIISTYGEYESKIDLANFPEIELSYINTDDEESYPLNYLLTLKKNIQMTLIDCSSL